MFTSIVFSKDRPLQLDLLLKSLALNCTDTKTFVLYTTSSDAYQESYLTLIQEHKDVEFVKQTYSIFDDVHNIVSNISDKYCCFLTDDCIFYRNLEINHEDLDSIFDLTMGQLSGVEDSNDKAISCLSLRVGTNTTTRQINNQIIQDHVPSEIFVKDDKFLLWNWTNIAYGGYWCYPLSVDGHIFKTNLIKDYTEELVLLNTHYSNRGVPRAKSAWKQTPNEFESKLQRFVFDLGPVCTSLKESHVVNSPNNMVQDSHLENRSGDIYNYTALDLKDEFDSGKRIDLNNLDFSGITCPHQEIDILRGL